jgi:hypothetical protein
MREMMTINPVNTYMAQPQFKKWSHTVGGITKEMWAATFNDFYKSTNHMKLIEHRYKIIKMIATSMYMRYKMKTDSRLNCIQCHAGCEETLEHILVECPKLEIFLEE